MATVAHAHAQVCGAAAIALLPWFPRIALDPGFSSSAFCAAAAVLRRLVDAAPRFHGGKTTDSDAGDRAVVFTTLSIGLVMHWLIPELPLAMAFALGAVVSPTDAVAVSAITQKLKVPARLSAVLNGESLMNDATGLVAFKFALGAMVAGSFSLRSATMEFVVLALGGTVLGLAVGWLVGRLRDALRHVRSSDVFIEVTLSLMSPYAAYLAANALGVSNILAVVAAGLYSGWRDPLRMDVSTRQTAWATWSMLLFWLNGLAFILLGLQLPGILQAVSATYSTGQLLLFTAAVSGVAILTRLL